MFDLMAAIRKRQNAQTRPPADSAETAESPQPRAVAAAESLRKTADKSEGPVFSATLRKFPQMAETRNPPETKDFRTFSANPQNPHSARDGKGKTSSATGALQGYEERAIRAWLAHIGESDPCTIGEVIDVCRISAEARACCLDHAAKEVPPANTEDTATCGACSHFQRIDHLHLGHCAKGEPEAAGGLWDTDARYCRRFHRRTVEAARGGLAEDKKCWALQMISTNRGNDGRIR